MIPGRKTPLLLCLAALALTCFCGRGLAAPDRERLRAMIGASDPRVPGPVLEILTNAAGPLIAAETEFYIAQAVRWPVFEGVYGEGVWLRPRTAPVAAVVVVPDADQAPEEVAGLAASLAPERQYGRRLAENGCEVLIPVLLARQPVGADSSVSNAPSGATRREWICRLGLPLGRHVVGFEVQKVLSAIDCLERENSKDGQAGSEGRSGIENGESARVGKMPLGVFGYGEGGLLAFYCAALDTRIQAALVSGYFQVRSRIWDQPPERSIWGLAEEFNDAEIAMLVAPRVLVVEHSPAPGTNPPGGLRARRVKPDYEDVERELERARALLKGGAADSEQPFKLISGTEGMATGPGSDRGLEALLAGLGVAVDGLKQPQKAALDLRVSVDPAERQRRQLRQLEEFTRGLYGKGRTSLK